MARDLASILPGVGQSIFVESDEIRLTGTPDTAGEIGVSGSDLTFYGTALETVRKKSDEFTFIHKVLATDIKTITASTASVLTRNAVGDISLNRTAVAAETHYFYPSLPGLFSETASKGVEIFKIRVAYELGVVDATSVDLVTKKVTYAQATDPVVAELGTAVADGQYDSNHDTAAKRKNSTVANGEHLLELTCAGGSFLVTADTAPVIELAVVLANTGTLKVRYFEIEYVVSEPAA